MEHLFVANQVLSNESQVIPTIQVLTEKISISGRRDLWVIESETGRLRKSYQNKCQTSNRSTSLSLKQSHHKIEKEINEEFFSSLLVEIIE